jgi:betaine-homocysteine S-methyltransferase
LAAAIRTAARSVTKSKITSGAHHIRSVAEAPARTPPASRYTADMSKHAFLGTDRNLNQECQEYADKL